MIYVCVNVMHSRIRGQALGTWLNLSTKTWLAAVRMFDVVSLYHINRVSVQKENFLNQISGDGCTVRLLRIPLLKTPAQCLPAACEAIERC